METAFRKCIPRLMLLLLTNKHVHNVYAFTLENQVKVNAMLIISSGWKRPKVMIIKRLVRLIRLINKLGTCIWGFPNFF